MSQSESVIHQAIKSVNEPIKLFFCSSRKYQQFSRQRRVSGKCVVGGLPMKTLGGTNINYSSNIHVKNITYRISSRLIYLF